jgi:hypothetical protein
MFHVEHFAGVIVRTYKAGRDPQSQLSRPG